MVDDDDGPDGFECHECGEWHSDDDFDLIVENPANAIPDPGQEEVMGRMFHGDERFDKMRQYQDDLAIAPLRIQQATVNCIFAQGEVRKAIAGAIRGATIATLCATPFIVLRLFRR